MPPKTKPAAKTAAAEVTLVSTAAAKKANAKPYLLDIHDGYVVVYYTEDGLDYAEVEIIVQGVLPANGYRFEVRPDGMAVTWMRAFHRACFSKDHLRHTMGSSFSLSNNRVTAYDNVTEEMKRARVTPDASNLYWGDPQVVPLKAKCTGTPEINHITYPTGVTASRNGKTHHMQFNSIYYCRVLLSEQRSSSTAKVSHQTVDLLDLPSSQSETNSPARRRRTSPRKRSHREGGNEVRDDDDDDNDDGGYGGGGRGGGGGGGKKHWTT